MYKWKQTFKNLSRPLAVALAACLPFILVNMALADPTYKSTNYGVDEVFMGAGGLNDASSSRYSARASLGDIVVGNSVGTDYQLYGGFVTTPDPYLELVVNGSNTNLGYLETDKAATTSGTFTVRAYLASGYVVVNGSDPPINGEGAGHTFTALTEPTAYAQNTEMFGINLVANTAPASVGADPLQIPDASYSFGTAATGYDTANSYQYDKGETIALSNKSSGTTQYTVSYMFGISEATPAGEYVFNHVIVVVATY